MTPAAKARRRSRGPAPSNRSNGKAKDDYFDDSPRYASKAMAMAEKAKHPFLAGQTAIKPPKAKAVPGILSGYLARPLEDRIIIEVAEAKGVSGGGIILPDSAKQKCRYGKVLSVGPGRFTNDGVAIPVNVEVDDMVWFMKYAGDTLREEERSADEEESVKAGEILIVRENDIVLVLEPEKK